MKTKKKKLGPLGEFLQELEDANEKMDNGRIEVEQALDVSFKFDDEGLTKGEKVASEMSDALSWQFTGTDSYDDIRNAIEVARKKHAKLLKDESRVANRKGRK